MKGALFVYDIGYGGFDQLGAAFDIFLELWFIQNILDQGQGGVIDNIGLGIGGYFGITDDRGQIGFDVFLVVG